MEKTIAERIDDLMERGWTAEALASAGRIPLSTLNKWHQRQRKPSHAEALHLVFDVLDGLPVPKRKRKAPRK